MLRTLFILLLLSLGLYWYTTVGQVCQAPLSYRLVTPIDERFQLSEPDAVSAIEKAISVYEQALGRQLFYRSTTDTADIAIHFVFDERQERAIAEESLRISLERKHLSTEALQKKYDELLAVYTEARTLYQSKVADYEGRLAKHNALVEAYNEAGGVPEEEYDAVTRAAAKLESDAATLEGEARHLSELAAEINALGETGNQIVRQYNDGVVAYNKDFSESEEFTQGDYQDRNINIYTFENKAELEQVLAHELGHALSLPHVEGSSSIMYYLLEDQPTPLTLSAQDTTALITTCGASGSVGTRIRALINRYLI